MDTKLDKKVDSAGGVTRHNAVYLGVCTVAVLIGGKPWTRMYHSAASCTGSARRVT
jgi:hypothetical protein